MGKHKKGTKKLLQEISTKILKLEEDIDKIKERPEYHINIDKLDIEQLQNLIFRLDKLDIKDLSGALNIGNNFDIKEEKEKEKHKKDKKESKKEKHKEKSAESDANEKENDSSVKFSNDLESIRALFKEITG